MRVRRALSSAFCVLALTGVAACGAADPGSSAPESSATGPVQHLSVSITGTTVTPAPTQVDLPVGSTLELVVTSDHDDEVHAHGFDVEGRLTAGQPTTLRLTASEPGLYEVETHEPPLTLLTVAVR